MDTIIRAVSVYVILLLIFRISGKRTLASISTFDFVLTLIISEAIQQALIDNDNSMTNAVLLVVTLIGLDIGLSLLKQRMPGLEKVIDGTPVLLIRDGDMQRDRMQRERVDEADILHAGRELEGLERLDQIKYAVIEQSGGITVVSKAPQVRVGERVRRDDDQQRRPAARRDATPRASTQREEGAEGGAGEGTRRRSRRRRGRGERPNREKPPESE